MAEGPEATRTAKNPASDEAKTHGAQQVASAGPADASASRDGASVRQASLALSREDELRAGVHEVQNALTAVMGWVELARGEGDPSRRDRALAVTTRALHRVRAQVAALADPAERFSVRARVFHAPSLVAEVFELLQPRCASVGVTLALDSADGVSSSGAPAGLHGPSELDADLRAVGDPDRALQILTNLVLNAVDAVLALAKRDGTRGRVELSVRTRPGRVDLRVRDDGVGMDARTLERAFEPHFTTHPEANGPRKKGSGLGLAISRALAEAMGGTLSVSSAPGQGSLATLSLLRDGARLEESISIPPAEDPSLRTGTRVLVVDDEPAIRELLDVALSLRGAQVVVAPTLAAAREALADPRGFDVLLIDESLGGSDSGASLVLEVVRSMPRVAPVLMTGAPSLEHLPPQACRWLLRKPFTLGEAVRLIAAAQSAHESTRG